MHVRDVEENIADRFDLDTRLRSLHIAGLYAQQAGSEPGVEWKYTGGAGVRTTSPVSRRVIERLNAAWPATVPVAALLDGLAAEDAARVIGLVSRSALMRRYHRALTAGS